MYKCTYIHTHICMYSDTTYNASQVGDDMCKLVWHTVYAVSAIVVVVVCTHWRFAYEQRFVSLCCSIYTNKHEHKAGAQEWLAGRAYPCGHTVCASVQCVCCVCVNVVDVHAVVVVAVHVVRVEVAFAAAATAKTVTTTATATSTFSNCVYVCSRYVNARSMYEHTYVHTGTHTRTHFCMCLRMFDCNEGEPKPEMAWKCNEWAATTFKYVHNHTYVHTWQMYIHRYVCETVIERRPPVTSLSRSLSPPLWWRCKNKWASRRWLEQNSAVTGDVGPTLTATT